MKENLIKLTNWAKLSGITYQKARTMIINGEISLTIIDGARFIDIVKYPIKK